MINLITLILIEPSLSGEAFFVGMSYSFCGGCATSITSANAALKCATVSPKLSHSEEE